MLRRLQIVCLAMATALAGSVAAQTQNQQGTTGQQGSSGQNPPDTGRGGPPTGSMPGNPGAVPSDQQMDPYGTDKDFVKNAGESSATAVQLGKLAQEKGSTDNVKGLGKEMVEAHTQTGQQLKQAAGALKMEPPSDEPRKAKKAEEKLSKLSGPDFDRAYVKMAADEQKQSVKQFQREAKDGNVPGLKDFAAKNLPAQQDREKRAEEMANGGTAMAAKQK